MQSRFNVGKLYGTIVEKDLFTGPIDFFLKNSDVRFIGTLETKTPFVLLSYDIVVETFYRVKILTSDGKIAWFLTHENQILLFEELV